MLCIQYYNKYLITKEILDNVGSPFISRKNTEHNMGLGIFIAKNLIENIGGNIKFYNKSDNLGSVVEILLKKNIQDNMEQSLIIIDDDAPFRDRLTRLMEKKGFIVEALGSENEAKKRLKEKLFTHAIIDMRLEILQKKHLILV